MYAKLKKALDELSSLVEENREALDKATYGKAGENKETGDLEMDSGSEDAAAESYNAVDELEDMAAAAAEETDSEPTEEDDDQTYAHPKKKAPRAKYAAKGMF